MTISETILPANRQATPLKKKITSPTVSIRNLFFPTDSLPESSTKGMMSSEGREVSIWIFRSVASGKIRFRSPRMGEIANPGSDATAETDQMASSTISRIDPLPVLIFIAGYVIPELPQLSYQKQARRAIARRVVSTSAVPIYSSFTQRICKPLARWKSVRGRISLRSASSVSSVKYMPEEVSAADPVPLVQ